MTATAILVDRSSEEPVYAQIARQVRTAIVRGDLAPGARLPTVRALAGDLGFNLNTVARAYRALEDEGFVVIRGRSGVRVAPPGDGDSVPERLREHLRTVLARLRQLGLSRREVERLIAAELRHMTSSPDDDETR